MPDVVRELLDTEAAVLKLGRRGISIAEAKSMRFEPHDIVPNPGRPGRRLLIGRTAGGRALTLVIEETLEPTGWVIVTGWPTPRKSRGIIG